MRPLLKYIAFGFGFLALLVLSWFFVHLFALFGLFLVLMYPLWWFLLSNYNLCLLCRVKREGEWCSLCKQQVRHVSGQHVPTIFSAVCNSVFILFLSAISIGVVFLESTLVVRSGWISPPATVDFAIPTKGQYGVGEIFPMKLEISGITMPVNVVQADISYDPARLEVVDISTNGSFATIFVQKEINNTVGFARLTGGIPNPGFAKPGGLFATVYLKGKSPGPVSVKFLPSTMALANDGKGTNVLKALGDIPYVIVPKDISRAKITKPTKVLGITTDDATKMIFYDDTYTNASATDMGSTMGETQKAQGNPVVQMVLNGLSSIDAFTITLWGRFLPK